MRRRIVEIFAFIVSLVLFVDVCRAERLVGEIRMWAGPSSAIPDGWRLCDGSELLRSQYSELFSSIGTIHGSGDGETTFNLPDFRDRSPIGVRADSSGVPVTFVEGTPTQLGGEASHQLTVDELPAHAHHPRAVPADGNACLPCEGCYPAAAMSQCIYRGSPGGFTVVSLADTTVTGGNQGHSILHPYAATTFIIAVEPLSGSAPAIGTLGIAVTLCLLLGVGAAIAARVKTAQV